MAPKNPDSIISLVPGGLIFMRELIRLAGLGARTHAVAPQSVLVVGCRTGESAVAIAGAHGCSVTGIDEETESILAAKVAAHEKRVENLVRFKVMSPLEMDFPEGSIDIILIEALLNSYPKGKILRRCRAILAAEGRLVISDSFWKKKPVPVYVRDVWEGIATPVPTMEEWRRILADAGFSVLHMVDASPRLEPFYRQFSIRYANPTTEQLLKLGPFRHIVPRYRHESNVYLQQNGAKWMGFAGIVARPTPEERPERTAADS